MAERLHLLLRHRQQIEALLRRHLPGVEVWAYGSRISGRSHEGSDLDLVLRGPGLAKIELSRLADFEEALRDSSIPFLVEARDWARLPQSFHREIERDHVVLVGGEDKGVASEWRVTNLGDLIDIKHGFAFKGQSIHEEPRGDVLLTPGNFAVGGGFKGQKFKYYDGLVPEEFVLRKGDLIVTMTDLSKQSDTLGYPAFVPACTDGRRFLHNQRLGKISLKDIASTEARFVYYVMCGATYRHEVLASATGTTVKHTSPDRIKRFRFPVPALAEQRAIAHILGTLDDTIELNQRMSETLEKMARALFKSWFIDFDPVHAKVALKRHAGNHFPSTVRDWSVERARSYLDRMDPDIGALFPDRFVDSELGPIPEGWAAKALGECVDVERGLSYKGSALSLSGVPMHNLNSIYEGGGYKSDGIKYYIGDHQARHVVEPGDVIVANTEQGHDRLLIGFSAIVPKYFGDNGLFTHHIYRVRPKKSIAYAPDFVCRLLNTQAIHDTVSGYATGTTVNMLPVDALKIPRFVAPPAQVVTTFSTIAEEARTRQEAFIAESHILVGLRDALLPKLISGEMRVRDQSRR